MDGLDQQSSPKTPRKRKAESQDNERLSKRLSLLNLEHNGSKLYVPVETPSPGAAHPSVPLRYSEASSSSAAPAVPDDTMRLDDSKHKVYIYNIEDELSSDSETEDGKLVFLPDIEKHLRQNRIPPHVLAADDGQLAGMQLVLYDAPKSLSVPEDEDSVRRAVIEARHRLRDKQRREVRRDAVDFGRVESPPSPVAAAREAVAASDDDAMDMD